MRPPGNSASSEGSGRAGGEVPSKARRLSPNPAELDRDKFEGFLAKLAALRATSFVPLTTKAGLDKPAMVVAASYDQGKFERVRFATVDADSFAAREGEGGSAKLEGRGYDEMVTALDTLLAPPAPAASNASPAAPAPPPPPK